MLNCKEYGILNFNERVLRSIFNMPTEITIENVYNKLFFIDIFDSNMEEFFRVRFDIGNKHNEDLRIRCIDLKMLRDSICNRIMEEFNILFKIQTELLEDDKDELFSIIDKIIECKKYDNKANVNDIEFYPWEVQYINYDIETQERILIQIKENVDLSVLNVNGRLYRYTEIIRNYINSKFNFKDIDYTDGNRIDVFFRTTFLEYDMNIKFNNNYYLKEMYAYVIDRKSFKALSKIECSSSLKMIALYNKLYKKGVMTFGTDYYYIKDILRFLKSKIPSKNNSPSDELLSHRNFNNEIVFLNEKSNFTYIEQIINNDKIIDFPYHSFDEYCKVLKEAVNREDVEEIHLNIYRIGSSNKLINILKKGIDNKKKIFVNCELNARFDELMNISWAIYMMDIGINVSFYKPREVKVHSKCTLIKFKNDEYISIIGTGNYNESTSSQYTDLMLLTSDNIIGNDLDKYFKLLYNRTNTNSINPFYFNKIIVSRINMREHFISLIKQETIKGTNGYISIKCNALDDKEIIYHLTNAAVYGVKIDLLIRGYCNWEPRPEWLESGQIRIRSIIWKHLEHSRIFKFGDKIFIGSIDLLKYKLNNRLEVAIEIKSENIKKYLNKYLEEYWNNFNDESFILYYNRRKGCYEYKSLKERY